jgi:hypothetical protein
VAGWTGGRLDPAQMTAELDEADTVFSFQVGVGERRGGAH